MLNTPIEVTSEMLYSLRYLKNMSNSEIGTVVDLPPKIVADRIRNHEIKLARELYRQHPYSQLIVNVPGSPTKIYNDFLTIEVEDVVIASDFEVPDHNPVFLAMVILAGIRYDIKHLILAGDVLGSDQQGIEGHDSVWVPSFVPNYDDMSDITVNIVDYFFEWYNEVYSIRGNHDDKAARISQGQITPHNIYARTKAVYSRYAWMHVQTSRGLVWVVHPRQYSKAPITLGQKLYNANTPKGHWILGHCHLRNDGWTEDGTHEVHSIGTGRDPEKAPYKNLNVSTHPQWNSSFIVIKGGEHIPLDLKSTNWRRTLGDDLWEISPLFKETPHARIWR